jgi:hypothetical protein
MKKLMVVFLIIAGAGGLAAQEFSFSGSYEGGIGVFVPDEGDPFLGTVSRDLNTRGIQASLGASFVTEEQNAGLELNVQAMGDFNVSREDAQDAGKSYGLGAYFDYAYAWYTMFDKKVKVMAGEVDDDTFKQLFDAGENAGILTIIRPWAPLFLGVGAYGGSLETGMVVDNMWDAKYTGALAFFAPDKFAFTTSYRSENKISNSAHDGQFVGEFTWLGFKGWRLTFINQIRKLSAQTNFGEEGIYGFYELFNFRGIENLECQLGFWQMFTQNKNTITLPAAAKAALDAANQPYWEGDLTPDMSFRAWFYVQYGLKDGKIVPRLDINYLLGGHHLQDGTVTHGGNNSDMAALDIKEGFTPNFNHKTNLLSLQPSVVFKFSKKAAVELGYIADIGMGDLDNSDLKAALEWLNKNAGLDETPLGGTAEYVNQAVYLHCTISF